MNTTFRNILARGLARAVPLAIQAGLLSAGGVSSVLAQEAAPFSVSGSVELGAEYNGNLNVSELESASGQSDTAAVLNAGLDLGWQSGPRLAAEGGYSYSASRYQDADDYDLDMHLLFGDLNYAFDLLTLGGSYYFADASLGGDDFLTLDQYSVYAGRLFAEQWYLRGALNFTDKSFDILRDRDADNTGYSLEGFWFFNQGRSNLMLAYGLEDEQTRDDQYAYQADTLRLRYTQRFMLAALEARLRAGYRWQDRDYRYITPSIGTRRDDRQGVAEVSLDISVLDNLEVIGSWEKGNYRSNLESADYATEVVSLSARLAF